jgi:hypothetical protein
MEQALCSAGLKKEDITGAGFGVAGYDWASEVVSFRITPEIRKTMKEYFRSKNIPVRFA